MYELVSIYILVMMIRLLHMWVYGTPYECVYGSVDSEYLDEWLND
jgi:hypothetical protein